MPTHYSFKQSNGVESIAREYERLKNLDTARLKQPRKAAAPRMTRSLAVRAKAAIDSLDDQGRWVEEGKMRKDADNTSARRIIDCWSFISNVRALSAYLAVAQ